MAGAQASIGDLADEEGLNRQALTQEEAAMIAANELAETDLMRDREDILYVVNTWLEESASGAISDFQRWLKEAQSMAYRSGMLRFPGRRPLETPMVSSLASYLRDRKATRETIGRPAPWS